MKRFLIGLIIGLVAWPIGVLCYLRFGHPPVAVADHPFPLEAQILKVPLHNRIAADQPKAVPIQPTEANLLAGAQVYSKNCATCHGMYNQTSIFAQHMYPWPPPLLQTHGANRVVGVTDDPATETYWKVSNGIRLTGMPAFKQVLTPTQIWQVSVLLANANKPMPPSIQALLNKP